MTLRPRRIVAALSASVVAAGLAAAVVPAANADDGNTITIVGTSDVQDSGLMTYLKPFYTQATGATYNYIGGATGAAITQAEAGTASVLIVHAASLENQFVAQGYSLERYGRSLFWGDYVLLGPKNSDPAGILANSPHDIVGAFERIAAAGNAGALDFVARTGSPGTTVQAHQLWALSNVGKCQVSAANGGGAAPSVAGANNASCNTTADLPAWYHGTGQTQGPSIVNADTCNYGHGQDCYVFTDRGTFQNLQANGLAQNLRIMVRNNDAKARGNQAALVNAFHAYAVNPARVPAGNAISTAGALKFLNWMTSPDGQKRIGRYLSADTPFIPAAAPTITVGQVRTRVHSRAKIRFAGRVSNAIPGYPALGKKRIYLRMVTGYGKNKRTRTVKVGHTTKYGFYRLSYRPTKTARYYLKVLPSAKVEISTLDPVFGNILQAGFSDKMRVKVIH